MTTKPKTPAAKTPATKAVKPVAKPKPVKAKPPAKAKPAAKKPVVAKPKAKAVVKPTPKGAIEKFGIDAIAAALANGTSMTQLSDSIGVNVGSLSEWIATTPERSARAREARIHAARVWDEKAISAIEDAKDPFELTKARELAQHYRWRASKTAPKDYGDKVEHTGADGGAIQHAVSVRFV
jgi:outer membrane biosynthesis protein TonB